MKIIILTEQIKYGPFSFMIEFFKFESEISLQINIRSLGNQTGDRIFLSTFKVFFNARSCFLLVALFKECCFFKMLDPQVLMEVVLTLI